MLYKGVLQIRVHARRAREGGREASKKHLWLWCETHRFISLFIVHSLRTDRNCSRRQEARRDSPPSKNVAEILIDEEGQFNLQVEELV